MIDKEKDLPAYDMPMLIYQEQVFLDGYLYEVYLEEHPDGRMELTHRPMYYTCWDGSIPF